MVTIPQAIEASEALSKHKTLVKAEFALLEAPPNFREGSSPGELIAAASKAVPDYRKEINRITEKSLAAVLEVEAMYRQVNDYCGAIFRCCNHMEHGAELGEIVDQRLSDYAKTVRRALLANVIERDEVENLCSRSRDETAEALRTLEAKSAFTKRTKRAIKKALLASTSETLEAVLSVKNNTLPDLERQRLMHFAKRTASRCEGFTKAYRATYYKKGGYRTDIPPYQFTAWNHL